MNQPWARNGKQCRTVLLRLFMNRNVTFLFMNKRNKTEYFIFVLFSVDPSFQNLFMLPFLEKKTLLKRVYCRRKEFSSRESKFFAFIIYFFSEGTQIQFCQSFVSSESASIPFFVDRFTSIKQTTVQEDLYCVPSLMVLWFKMELV